MAVRDYIAKFVADLTGYKLEPAIRESKDLEHASDQSAAAVESSWRDAERGVQQSTRGMSHSLDGLGHQAAKASERFERGLAHGSFKEAGKEVGAEFAQNVGQGLSTSNITTLAQDTAGGLVAAFANLGGPVGLALAPVGAAAAVVFASITANAAHVREAVSTMFEDLVGQADKASRFRTALTESFGGVTEGLEEIHKLSERTGLSVGLIGDAFAGDEKASRTLRSALDEIEAKGTHTYKSVTRTSAGYVTSIDDSAQAANALEGHLSDVASWQAQAARDAATFQQATSDAVGPAAKVAGSYKVIARQSALIKSPTAALKAAAGVLDPDQRRQGAAPGGSRG